MNRAAQLDSGLEQWRRLAAQFDPVAAGRIFVRQLSNLLTIRSDSHDSGIRGPAPMMTGK